MFAGLSASSKDAFCFRNSVNSFGGQSGTIAFPLARAFCDICICIFFWFQEWRIRQGRYIFGGFNPEHWAVHNRTFQAPAPSSFLFTLTNPHNIPPTKLAAKTLGRSHFSVPRNGPSFGQDMQVPLYTGNNTCTSNFPQSFIDTTGKGQNLFAGSSSFQVNEVEVYAYPITATSAKKHISIAPPLKPTSGFS